MTATPQRRIVPEDLYRIPVPSDPQLSPDGRRVAWVVGTADKEHDGYVQRIWMAASEAGRPVELTRGRADSAPRWSPDGSTLAFLSKRDHDESPQLYLLPLGGGEARRLTSLPCGTGPAVWSHDGSRIAFIAVVDLAGEPADDAERRRRTKAPVVVDRLGYKADGAGLLGGRRQHLFVVDVAQAAGDRDGADGGGGSEPVALTEGDWSVDSPAWSPDDRHLAVAGAQGDDRDIEPGAAIVVVPAGGGPARRVSPALGSAAGPLWSSDGSRIVYAGDHAVRPGHARLLAVPAEGGAEGEQVMELAPGFDRNIMLGAPGYPGGPFRLGRDGAILFCARDRGATRVYSLAPGHDPVAVAVAGGGDRSIAGLSVALTTDDPGPAGPGADKMAYVVASPASPGEVTVADLGGNGERQLTTLFADALPDVDLLVPEEHSFTAPDGTPIQGWVLRDAQPRGAQTSDPAPLLLDVHGGPHNAWGPMFDGAHLYHQALAAEGWVVLTINPRGSDGYGEDFYRAVVGAWGTADQDDFLAAVDTLVAEGVADPDRLAVTGYSYGGYMTCWLAATTDRFSAAVAGGCVSDLGSEFASADMGWFLGTLEVGAAPVDDPARYARHSPITQVGQVSAPTLLLHGERDDRCPVGQAEAWFTALRSRRVPCRLVRYPGASHLFIVNGPPSQRVDYSQRVIDWVRAHTTGDTADVKAPDTPSAATPPHPVPVEGSPGPAAPLSLGTALSGPAGAG